MYRASLSKQSPRFCPEIEIVPDNVVTFNTLFTMNMRKLYGTQRAGVVSTTRQFIVRDVDCKYGPVNYNHSLIMVLSIHNLASFLTSKTVL